MGRDLRYAFRRLRRSPGFALGAAALLAFGLAACTTIFSLVDALLLRPLPVRDPERLVRLVTVREQIGVRSQFLVEEYENWKKEMAEFEDMLAWAEHDLYVTVGEAVERAQVHFVTDNFFSALGAAPALGRLLGPQDQAANEGAPPAVLSYPYWRRRFHGDPGVVGRTIEINGRKSVVVGVTARGFNGLAAETSPDLRVPLGWLRTLEPNLEDNRAVLEVAARLRSGASPSAARQHAEAIWRAHWKELNGTDPGLPGRFDLEPAARGVSRIRARLAGALWLTMGGVGLLLLMVCANVAGLLLARHAARRSELALRVALGASRVRLVHQMMAESALLALAGAAGAAALCAVAIPLLAGALPPVRDAAATRLTLALEIGPDWRVLGFAVAVSAAVVVLAGLFPALASARGDLHPFLKEARAGGGRRGRQALVALQVGLCTLLLAGAGISVLTLRRLETMDPGFRRGPVIVFGVDPAMARYTKEQGAALQRRLLEGARNLPGVESAALASRGLMRGTGIRMTVTLAGERAAPDDFLNSSLNAVSPEYFQTMGIPFLEGRNFRGIEYRETPPKPVIVNEAFACRFGRGRSAIGLRFGGAIVNAGPAAPDFEVIGVVGDAKYRSLREPFHPIVYQAPAPDPPFLVILRTRGRAEMQTGPMLRLLAGVDPRLSFVEITTLEGEVAASIWAERTAAVLASAFALAAACIAAAGLYALIAFAVAQRRREIGVRMALGASPGSVARLMLGRAAALAVAGIAGGLAFAWALAPRLAPLLYEADPRDWGVFAVAAGVALAAAALAALAPSLRAARLSPWAELREE